MTLEELKTRYEKKSYAVKQSECMKKLLAYRSMMEYRDECMEYAGRVEEMQKLIDFAIEHHIYIPLFFGDYHYSRIDDYLSKEKGKRKFCWIYNEDYWGTWEDGEIKAYHQNGKQIVEVKPTEALYISFLEYFAFMEKELNNHLERYLEGF